MELLRSEFGVERLAGGGGGHINDSMLDLGLIDEISMMYGYGIDGREGMAAAFDGAPRTASPSACCSVLSRKKTASFGCDTWLINQTIKYYEENSNHVDSR